MLLLCSRFAFTVDVFQMSISELLIGDDEDEDEHIVWWECFSQLLKMLMVQPERWKHRFNNTLFSVLFGQVNLRNLNTCLSVK